MKGERESGGKAAENNASIIPSIAALCNNHITVIRLVSHDP